jgi:hypothetical protein
MLVSGASMTASHNGYRTTPAITMKPARPWHRTAVPAAGHRHHNERQGQHRLPAYPPEEVFPKRGMLTVRMTMRRSDIALPSVNRLNMEPSL